MEPRTPTARGLLESKREEQARHLKGLSGGLEISHAAEEQEAAINRVNREDVAEQVRRARKAIADLDCAIARVNLGIYGICTECDGEISPKRLAAIPEAPRCLKCEEQLQ